MKLKIFLLIFVSILLVGTVSADLLAIDNYVQFDGTKGKYGTIDVWDGNIFTADKHLSTMILNENTDTCLIDCYAEGEATLYQSGELMDDLFFENFKGDEVNIKDFKIYINSSYVYYYSVMDDKKINCSPSGNGTNSCLYENKIVNTTLEGWERYNYETLPIGNYKWKIVGKKDKYENVDWIPTSFGKDLTQWAWWNSVYLHRRNVTGLGNVSMPINGTEYMNLSNVSTIIYAFGENYSQTMAIYYNDSTNFAFANDTDQFWGVQTVPNRIISGALPSNLTFFLPMDVNRSGNFTDFANNLNVSLISQASSTLLIHNFTGSELWGGVELKGSEGAGGDAFLRYNVANQPFQGAKGTLMFLWQPRYGCGLGGVNFDPISTSGTSQYVLSSAGNGETRGTVKIGTTSVLSNTTCGWWTGGEWNWTTITWDTDTDVYKIYNGKILRQSSTTPATPSSVSQFYVGNFNGASGGDVMNFSHILGFNRTLTSQEINDTIDMFTSAQITESIVVVALGNTLSKPLNNSQTYIKNLGFEGSFTSTNANITNATLNIWYFNGTLLGQNTTAITGTSNTSNLTFTIPTKNNFTWNYQLCAINSTDTICQFAPSNFTFNRTLYNENSQTYNTSSVEGSLESFVINFTMDAGLQLSSTTLWYNNTAYTGFFSGTGSEKIAKANVTVPFTGNSYTYNLSWEIKTNDGDSLNSTVNNQTITTLTIDDCSGNNVTLYNFTSYDEKTQVILPSANSSAKLNLQLFDLSNNQLQTFNKSYTTSNTYRVCMNTNLSGGGAYKIDVEVEYTSDAYSTEFYNIQKDTLNSNDTYTNISLYLLNTASSQRFEIIYKDADFLPVSDALIQVQRKYIDEGVFKTVEIPLTDYSGTSLASLELNNVIYTFVVVKNGVVLGTFSDYRVVCDNPTLGDCKINLNSFSSSLEPSDFTQLDDISLTISYNETLREVSSTFSIPSGTTSTLLLNVTKYDALGTTSACYDTLTSSSGEMSCTIPSNFGNGTVIVVIEKDGSKIADGLISLEMKPSDLYGNSLVFLLLFLYLTLLGAGISDNPMITGVFLIIGVIIAIGLNLVDTGIGTGIKYGATMLWFIIAVVLISIKGAKRGI